MIARNIQPRARNIHLRGGDTQVIARNIDLRARIKNSEQEIYNLEISKYKRERNI